MSLLEQFALRHTQLTQLQAELHRAVDPRTPIQAHVELNLAPGEMQAAAAESLPTYQVTATLSCTGTTQADDQPLFTVKLVMQMAYGQIQGDSMPFEAFQQQHTELARQIYPLLHHQLRPVLQQLGLDQVRLPYDLAGGGGSEGAESATLH